LYLFFFSSRGRHTSFSRDWSSDVCSSDLPRTRAAIPAARPPRPSAPPRAPRAGARPPRRAPPARSAPPRDPPRARPHRCREPGRRGRCRRTVHSSHQATTGGERFPGPAFLRSPRRTLLYRGHVSQPTAPRPRLRLTRRGRLVRSLLVLVLAVLLVIALISLVR